MRLRCDLPSLVLQASVKKVPDSSTVCQVVEAITADPGNAPSPQVFDLAICAAFQLWHTTKVT